MIISINTRLTFAHQCKILFSIIVTSLSFFLLSQAFHLGSHSVASNAQPPPTLLVSGPSEIAEDERTLIRSDSIQSNSDSPRQGECGVISDVGKNYLTPIDVVVKNEENNMACIRARFALSIKVEESFQLPSKTPANETAGLKQPQEIRAILGYLPLENVLKVEDTCPQEIQNPIDSHEDGEKAQNQTTNNADSLSKVNPNELEMIVTFECGKLSFIFQRDENKYFMSSIKGIVKLDKKVKREFIVNRPMFLTSDLTHRFKYDDLIEIGSEARTKAYILSANFYFTEIEVFRNTASRDFTRPPDDGSKPFLEDK